MTPKKQTPLTDQERAAFLAKLETKSFDELIEIWMVIAGVQNGMSFRKIKNLIKKLRKMREAGGHVLQP